MERIKAHRHMLIINESGLYSLVLAANNFSSHVRNAVARDFKEFKAAKLAEPAPDLADKLLEVAAQFSNPEFLSSAPCFNANFRV